MPSILDKDLTRGIGQLVANGRLRVPYYQRSYAWKKAQVRELYDDLRKAIDEDRDFYFLGSVVGCQVGSKGIEIVDGQQRIATTAILIAAIRNKLLELNDREIARRFEEQYLFHEKGLKDPVKHPSVRLNEADDDYFQARVIARPTGHKIDITISSHRLIDEAAKIAAGLVKEIVGTRKPADQKGELDKWVDFIADKARVIFIVVDDPADAFMIFETLNDRGLDLTVADLTKNYLLMRAGKEQVDDAKNYWTRMVSILGTMSDSVEVAKTYIHHLWSSYEGVTRDKDLFRDLRDKYDTSSKALAFTKKLCEKSSIYAALGNSDSEFWNQYGRPAKLNLKILNSSLKVTQVRMLLLAVADHFSLVDTATILQCCVWWSVRFLIAGGSPSKWESHYASRAKAIREGHIKNANELIESMISDVPDDRIFTAGFAVEGNVNKGVARYFLNCFEAFQDGKSSPHLGTDDPDIGSKEHVLPDNPDWSQWSHITKNDHERLCELLGNHTLLTPEENKARGNGSFSSAKKVYAQSSFRLTRELAKHSGDWDEAAIQKRQDGMAKMAVIIWPHKPQTTTKKKGK